MFPWNRASFELRNDAISDDLVSVLFMCVRSSLIVFVMIELNGGIALRWVGEVSPSPIYTVLVYDLSNPSY